jgi:L-alanine-DL-glutamate epimerase-like enolase superfamily enzyme
MRITRINCELEAPVPKPAGRVSLMDRGTPAVPKRFTIAVETDEGLSGTGFTLVSGLGAATVMAFLESELGPAFVGADPLKTDANYAKAKGLCEPTGWPGFASRAYAAIDFACWDIKAKATNRPLGDLLGGVRTAAPFFVSDAGGPNRSAHDVVQLAKPWIAKGAKGVRVDVGSGDVQTDADRVRAITDEIGDDCWVGVSAEGRYDLATALALAHFFDDIGVGWFEAPLPLSDRDGYRRLADRMETILAAGGSCDTVEELIELAKTGAVRVLRPDLLRIGGITPVLKLAAVAEACHCSMVPVRLPEIAESLCRGLSVVPQIERASDAI